MAFLWLTTFGTFMQVYEHGLSTVKIPKSIINGSSMLMGFPDSGSSYYLVMQLDKDFKPLFKLLETQPDPSGELTHVLRYKNIDIGQMQMLEDEMNLSLVGKGKLHPFLPSAAGPNQTSEHAFLMDFGLETSMQNAGGQLSGFSSLVDEVFGQEKGSSVLPHSVQNFSSSLSAPVNHYGSVPMILLSTKGGISSPKWEGGMPMSNAIGAYGSMYSSNNAKGPVQSSSMGMLPAGQGWISTGRKLPASKSEQNLASLRSPPSVDNGSGTAMDEEQLRVLSDNSNDTLCGNQSSQLLSPPRPAGARISTPNSKPDGSLRIAGSGSCVTTPICKIIPLCVYSYHVCFWPYLI